MAETVFLREHKDRNYTVLNNTFIKDGRLSWQAKGVMTYLLSLPEDWEIYLSEIEQHATNGRDSLRRCIKELKDFGYLEYFQEKDGGRFGKSTYRIVETPESITENPITEKPFTENPTAEKPKLQNTNKQSTNKQNSNKQQYSKQQILAVIDTYSSNFEKLFKKGFVARPEPVINFAAITKQIKDSFNLYGVDAVTEAVRVSVADDWLVSIGYPLSAILSTKMLPKYINGFKPVQKKEQAYTGQSDYSSSF